MRRLILRALLPAMAAGLALVLWWSPDWTDARQWPIRWLEVSGQLERITAAQVRAAVADQAGRGFFVIDVDRAREAIEALPWVARASVARHWPDALSIHVTEHRAVARWNGTKLLSARGDLFEVAGTAGMQGLVALHGPPGRAEEVFDRWMRMRGALDGHGVEIERVELDARGAWRVGLGDGRVLLLGRESVHARLARFIAVLPDLDRIGAVTRIDLRYPNGLAVTRSKPGDEQALAAGDRTLESAEQSNHG